MNKIDAAGIDLLKERHYRIGDEIGNADGIMVRSAGLHDLKFNPELKAIARAGAGTNNIPIDRCSEAGIVVFNTPGSNANSVKELVLAGLLLSSRNIIGGHNWVQSVNADVESLVESEKSHFTGPEIQGKTLGVVGLGAIGLLGTCRRRRKEQRSAG